MLNDIKNIEFLTLPENIASGTDYNTFMKGTYIWRELAAVAKRVLIFQSDSLMIHSGIDKFLKYDYIGAPWHLKDNTARYSWLKKLQKSGSLKQGIGNGGFSLRNPEVMLNITTQYMKKLGRLNEDVFFSTYVELLSLDNMSVFPTRETANLFAVETPCDDIAETSVSLWQNNVSRIPLAIHTAWAYFDIEQTQFLLNYSLL
jgi:hypothetical protein